MNAARRQTLSAIIAAVTVIGLPTANAVAAITATAPGAASAKAKAKTAAARAAAARARAAKARAAKARAAKAKAAAAKAAAAKAATTTVGLAPAQTIAISTPVGTKTIGPALDPLPTTTTAKAVPSSGAHTYVGDAIEMDQWGPVTVTIVVENGKLVDVSADLPLERPRSNFINTRVGPYLSSQAVQLQSSKLDLIAGATRTCIAYTESLQSALDRAGIKT